LFIQARPLDPGNGRARWISPACLAGGLLLLLSGALPAFWRFGVGTALLAVSVSTIDFSYTRFRHLLASPMLTWLGLISYSLYLWQQPFFMSAKIGVPVFPCILLSLLCALWSYFRIEQPARRFINERWSVRKRLAPCNES
jgi:peptidoglycan/LPS O-acetylase OafA/YrhL